MQNDISSLYIDLSQTKKKTSKIVGARHASPLSRRTPLRPEGDACVAPTFPLCRAVARQLTREISELINEAPGGASSSRGTRRVNLLKPAGGFYRALGEAGPIPSPTRGKLLPPAGSLAHCGRVRADAVPRPERPRPDAPRARATAQSHRLRSEWCAHPGCGARAGREAWRGSSCTR